jgi:hypothetical protein
MGFIARFLKNEGTKGAQEFTLPCLRALAELAYRRAAKIPGRQPFFIVYYFELKRVSEAVHVLVMIRYGPPVDAEIRSILLRHGVDGVFNVPNQLPDPTSPSVTPPAGAGVAPSVAADH